MAETTQAEPEVELIAPNSFRVWWDGDHENHDGTRGRWLAGVSAFNPEGKACCGLAQGHTAWEAITNFRGFADRGEMVFSRDAPPPPQWRR
jgi:hypothetical protein